MVLVELTSRAITINRVGHGFCTLCVVNAEEVRHDIVSGLDAEEPFGRASHD